MQTIAVFDRNRSFKRLIACDRQTTKQSPAAPRRAKYTYNSEIFACVVVVLPSEVEASSLRECENYLAIVCFAV
jgi:hypothetical protein